MNISSGTPFRGRAVPAPLRDEQGRDRRLHAGAREGARQGRRPRQLRRPGLHDVAGRAGQPRGRSRSSATSRSRRARSSATRSRRTSSARSSTSPGRRRRSSPGQTIVIDGGQTSIDPRSPLAACVMAGVESDREALALRVRDGVETIGGNRVVYDLERDVAHFGAADGRRARRSSGSSTTTRPTPRARCSPPASQLDPFAEWVVRCDRVDFPLGGDRLPAHPSRARDPLPAPRRDRDRDGGALVALRPGRRLVRERARSRARTRVARTIETAFVRALVLPAEWEGKRTIRYVDPADDDRAEAPARDDLLRARDRSCRAVSRTGGRILVDQLALHGVDLVFGVPGESYIAVLDALRDTPRSGTSRAATRAVRRTWRRPTGSSPAGRASASSRAARARRTPRSASTRRSRTRRRWCSSSARSRASRRGREAFQEVDYRADVRAAWRSGSRRSISAERIPELVARAFATAMSGRPGPVVLALPEDMLVEEADVARRRARTARRRSARRAETSSALRELLAARGASARDRRRRSRGAPRRTTALAAWCEASGIPVAAAWRCQDYVDNRSPLLRGAPRARRRPARSRSALARRRCPARGRPRLGDIETAGYTAIVPPGAGRTLVHVHPDPRSSDASTSRTLAIVASGPALRARARALRAARPRPRAGGAGRGAHADYLANSTAVPLPGARRPDRGDRALARAPRPTTRS